MMRMARFPVLAGILVAVSAPDARAEAPSCSQVAIEADPSIETRWPALPKHLRDALKERDDVDRCARITLTFRDGMIDVEVSLPDGRSAHRSVPRRDDVTPALEALLIVPQTPPTREEPRPLSVTTTSTSSTASATTRAVQSTGPAIASVPVREAPSLVLPRPSSHLTIELSAWTGARIGDGRASVGFGALSFLDLSGWLVGFAGRADRYQTLGRANPSGALELALLGGRRMRFQTMALDLVSGPAVALGGTTTYSTQVSTTGDGVSASASNTVPRFLVEARLAFAALSTVHTFVAVDGDFGPASSPDASRLPDARRLPTWTAGLALGATVGTQ
jgi:hypothetical protein